MSMFEYRKPPARMPARDDLKILQKTLDRLNADPEETPGIVDLKRILAARIAEMECRSA